MASQPGMRRPRRGSTMFAVGGLVVLLVLGILLPAACSGGDDGKAVEDVATVPSVVGLPVGQAEAALARAGLESGVERRPGRKPAGRVIGQRPRAGSTIERGRAILLIVSTGRPPSRRPPDQTETTETDTTGTPTGTVETQPVDTVAVGPEPPLSQVPGVLNVGFVDSARFVERRGFVADTYPVALEGLRGEVVRQKPEPGTMLAKGRTVRLYVAVGTGVREPARVPDVAGLKERAARDTLYRVGFTARTVNRGVRKKSRIGDVLVQKPAAGQSRPVLTQVWIVVGR